MTEVHLSKIMKDLGITSVRELFNRTGSSEQSVFKQAQIAAIDSLYLKNKSFRGSLGFPLNEVQFNDNERTAERRYAGGTLKFQLHGPQCKEEIVVRVRFVGFHCKSESEWDQGSNSDEPYFIIGVAGSNGSNTVGFGPYEDVDGGENGFEASYIVDTVHKIKPPIVLGVTAWEYDYGTPEEAEGKVRKVFEEIEKKFEQALGLVGESGDSHVMPEWAREIYIGWLPEGIAAVFGLGDDKVGYKARVFFDYKPDLLEWGAPKVIGKHGDNEYNVVINVDGGDQGNYDLYFLVDLFRIEECILPHKE
ncbi:hypothetical protein [Microcoleus sp. FACHB-672]|uniref:hypothetical protein n=1 Tax=Microcoleus sp. FACHB-672 TaxID=2692825 RepID=UPI00168726F7|nr:hypothetical protein [Microcoleus sp. FACHB-672]MBD2039377.1 hypothetical protein [Microcoleus sp. FACHB-672]